jgi:octaprenyl-diphosphate synthase
MQPQTYQQIRSVVESDFLAVDRYIIEQLHSDVPLVENIGHYIVEAGGKRLRPILVLLAARACGIEAGKQIALAAVIEFIHTATLLHDDVVDMSSLRRGRPTVNAEWNNPSSVLVGDFIYSRAFQILVEIGDMRIMQIMADTTNKIAEGEVLQLITKNNPQSSEQNYMQVIRDKTAILFQAAAQCGAILAESDDKVEDSLKQYGMHLGIAFQLIDDVLDYDGDTAALGKNIGDDLAEGKPTVPLIYAMQHGSQQEAALIRQCISEASVSEQNFATVIKLVTASGALEYTRQLAAEQAQLALQSLAVLSASEYRDSLEALVKFSINRQT